jgi:hypothetical protein
MSKKNGKMNPLIALKLFDLFTRDVSLLSSINILRKHQLDGTD